VRFTAQKRDLQLQIVFAFMIVYAAILFVVRPAPTTFQVLFRAAVAATGVVGLLSVGRRRRGRRR
jgi:hypothetical protein